MEISEREFAVIREISNHKKPTQRHIAKQIGISLGLTNLIIKRLIKKGYIKIQEAPPRTIMYILTPKGLAEKTNKSYQFTLKTINLMKNIKERIQNIIKEEYEKGTRQFFVSGNGELSTLTEIALRDMNLEEVNFMRRSAQVNDDSQYCHLIASKDNSERQIDILTELAKRGLD